MQKLKHVHPIKRFLRFSVMTRVLIISSVLLVIAGGLFGWARWQDAQNEQFLRDIVADFDALEAQLEQEIGIAVEDKSGCFTTSEKFGGGKTGCFVRLSSSQNSNNIKSETLNVITNQNEFMSIEENSERYYVFIYHGQNCHIAFNQDSNYNGFAIECPVTVRGANNELVKELFN